MTNDNKRANGRYYTVANLFDTKPFREWAKLAGLLETTLIEPFAGHGDLVRMLRELNLCGRARLYDIEPAAKGIKCRDTLTSFPHNAGVVVTNPPWLARNSATRRGLHFPYCEFDDLYKHCLSVCLENADYVAAIIPASFLSSRLFRSRLCSVDIAAAPVFSDTENPTCLAMFSLKDSKDVSVYNGGKLVGKLSDLERHLPRSANNNTRVQFNIPNGRLGLVAIDNTRQASIRFCRGSELEGYPIGQTSRMITRISGNFGRNIGDFVESLNERFDKFREETSDVFLTPFKGLRRDGKYRRRLDYALAREFIRGAQGYEW